MNWDGKGGRIENWPWTTIIALLECSEQNDVSLLNFWQF